MSSFELEFSPTELHMVSYSFLAVPHLSSSSTDNKRHQHTNNGLLHMIVDNVQDVIHHGKRTIYTAGRPPWYDMKGELKNAFVIGETVISI